MLLRIDVRAACRMAAVAAAAVVGVLIFSLLLRGECRVQCPASPLSPSHTLSGSNPYRPKSGEGGGQANKKVVDRKERKEEKQAHDPRDTTTCRVPCEVRCDSSRGESCVVSQLAAPSPPNLLRSHNFISGRRHPCAASPVGESRLHVICTLRYRYLSRDTNLTPFHCLQCCN